MAAESMRITGSSVEPICNINGSQKKLFSLSSSANFHRRRRINVSSSISEFFGGVRISRCNYRNAPALHNQRKNFSVFAMAADGINYKVLNFTSFLLIFMFFLCFWDVGICFAGIL